MTTNSPPVRISGARRSVDLRTGSLVIHKERTYRIESIIDFENLVGVDVEQGTRAILPIPSLSAPIPRDENLHAISADIATIDPKAWSKAQERYAAILPLLGNCSRKDVEARSQELKISVATLYRWLQKYRGQGTPMALIAKSRGPKKGSGRLTDAVESVIDAVIKEHYLTPQRYRISKIAKEVHLRCRRKSLPPPHYNAVRRRIYAIPESQRLRARGARELADRKYRPVPGHFPETDYPLAVVQIDHTQLDVTVVDDEHRESIGRPWLTLAMDVYSRMVTGYYLSLDSPCEASVGICVARSIMPKETLLQNLGVDAKWPVWGVMSKIYVDNGADFRSGTFRASCERYGINLEFRPVKQPRFGGHIERLLGTVAREMHTLPGTTFSSIKERGEYRPDRHAALTLDELEKWLVKFICSVYHQRSHSALGVNPRRQWDIGIFGIQGRDGRGLLRHHDDERRLILDFMPMEQRQIQPVGVSIDGLRYYHEALKSWIGAADPENSRQKRKFVFRRDPRDISKIWFFDPASDDYYEIPLANAHLPRMSLWEYTRARKAAREEGMKRVDDHQIARTIEDLRRSTDEAAKKTKSARRATQRRRQHERSTAKSGAAKPISTPSPPSIPIDGGDQLLDDVDPFEERQ